MTQIRPVANLLLTIALDGWRARVRRFALVCGGSLISLPAHAEEPFEPTASFSAFSQLFLEGYAYLDRGDVAVVPWLYRTEIAVSQAKDAATFRSTLNRALVVFCDPHLLVTPLSPSDPNVWPTSADLVITETGGSFWIADVRAESPADLADLRPGLQILAADGVPLAEAVRSWLAPFVEIQAENGEIATTPEQRAYVATLLVNGRREGPRRLLVSHAKRFHEVELANPRDFAKVVADRPPLTVRREGRVLILRPENSLGRPETIAAFDTAISENLDAKGVIIDLRNTPSGGNTDVARAIIGHFVSEPQPYQVHTIPAVARDTGVPRHFVEYALPRAPLHTGKLVVLGGSWTGSMGEGLLIGLDAAANAHTIASDMGDLLGALYVEPIPGASLEFGMEALFHVNGTPRADYVADQPLASADRTVEGGDPALGAALLWLEARGE
jgi:hypothetical protein